MKTYYNGPRKGMMYGGGATPRKPMMYGGMTKKKKMQMGGMMDEKNIKPNQSGTMQATMPKNMMNPMGMRKGGKLSAGLAALKKERPDVVKKMGFRKGGKTEETKVAVSSAGMNEYGLAAKKVGDKYESYKGGKKTGTFNSLKALKKHQLKLIEIDDNLASRT